MIDHRLPGVPAGFSEVPAPAAASFAPPRATGIPLGSIMWNLVAAALPYPEWINLDGQEELVADFPDLAALVGTQFEFHFGAASSGRFRLPSLRGRMLVTPDQSPGGFNFIVGEHAGEKAHTTTTAEMPPHGHPVRSPNAPSEVVYYDFAGGGAQTRTILRPNTGGVSEASGEWSAAEAGGGAPHNNMPPYLVLPAKVRALP